MSSLARPRQHRVIAGVCAGIAQRFGLTPWTVRAVFLVSCLLPGPQFLIYLALWLVLPQEP
ncbi:PspC domain-containing protein [Kitasatospora phosalacinea]|uniref:PspC domain-containing protein n=1 Tax=Kitasatospora phosalacinea TaxID=2065 RepID=UPI003647616B